MMEVLGTTFIVDHYGSSEVAAQGSWVSESCGTEHLFVREWLELMGLVKLCLRLAHDGFELGKILPLLNYFVFDRSDSLVHHLAMLPLEVIVHGSSLARRSC